MREKLLITFHADPTVYKLIKQLVKEGRYESISQFVLVALQEFLDKWRVVKDGFEAPTPSEPDARRSPPRLNLAKEVRDMLKAYVAEYVTKKNGKNDIVVVKVAEIASLLCGEYSKSAIETISLTLRSMGTRWRTGIYIVDVNVARQYYDRGHIGKYDVSLLASLIC